MYTNSNNMASGHNNYNYKGYERNGQNENFKLMHCACWEQGNCRRGYDNGYNYNYENDEMNNNSNFSNQNGSNYNRNYESECEFSKINGLGCFYDWHEDDMNHNSNMNNHERGNAGKGWNDNDRDNCDKYDKLNNHNCNNNNKGEHRCCMRKRCYICDIFRICR